MRNSEVIETRAPSPASPASQSRKAPHRDHVAQFYESEQALSETVGAFLAEGLRWREPTLVLASEAHWESFRFRLGSGSIDLAGAMRDGWLVVLDAQATLDIVMRNGLVDADVFRSHISGVLQTLARQGGGTRIRAYGELVDMLWRDGQPQQAIRVEELWNELADTHHFQLLCAYAMGNLYREGHSEALAAVCREHGRIIAPPRIPAANRVRDEDANLLQQRADSLESELEHRIALEEALRDALAERRRAEEILRRDVAERIRVESELREAKDEAERANRVKSEFLAVMSHELRTPLNAIMGYEQLLSQGIAAPVSDIQVTYLDRIRQSAGHLLRLIDDVLNIARIEAGTQEYVLQDAAIAEVTSSAAGLVAPQAMHEQITIVSEIAADLRVHCDVEKARQILLNLLSNAVKFTPPCGSIVITAAQDDSGHVAIRVVDSGCGVPQDKHEVVFQRFVQLDSGSTRQVNGTGLGLSISRDFARAMGGDLRLDPSTNGGATFVLLLPSAVRSLEV